ncbi:MAG: cupin domain-containing protein [Chitinivibrionales bacterium]|nr:cupin domain-containing protein [Chitinivibrionales bacterium]
MQLFRIHDLPDIREGHFLSGILDEAYLCNGGLGFKKRGHRTHTADGAGGSDRHVHDDDEVFVILQGKAKMEINGKALQLTTGDICVVEAGEDHHLVSDVVDPCVNLWLHGGIARHPAQEA